MLQQLKIFTDIILSALQKLACFIALRCFLTVFSTNSFRVVRQSRSLHRNADRPQSPAVDAVWKILSNVSDYLEQSILYFVFFLPIVLFCSKSW